MAVGGGLRLDALAQVDGDRDALLAEAVGMVHYRHDPRMSDEELFDKGYNRVYDTLELEKLVAGVL